MRTAAALAALVALVPVVTIGAAAPAYADTTVVVKGVTQDNIRSVEGPAGVPTGLGSLKLYHRASAPSTVYRHLMSHSVAISTIDTLTITYTAQVPVTVQQIWTYDRLGTGDETTFETVVVRTTLPASRTWRTANLLAGTRDWSVVPRTSTKPGDLRSGSMAELVAAYPDTTVGIQDLALTSTTVTGAAWIDRFQYGATGDVTTLAFDVDPVPVVRASAADVVIAAGGSTPLTGRVLRLDGTPFVGLTMDLYKQVSGDPTRYKALSVTTGADGRFGTVVSPTRKTTYWWQVNDGTGRYYVSPTRVVYVKPALTLRVADATVTRPTPLVLAGTASTVLVGTTVTIRRTDTLAAIATTTVAGDGTFRVSAAAPRGKYDVVVTSPAAKGLLAGRSAPVHVWIR